MIWGKAAPGGKVIVSMGEVHDAAVAGADSQWTVELPAFSAGGPYVMTVAGEDTTTFGDVLVGDVWICSGQSNMEWRVQNTNDAADEIAAADWEDIRLFDVEHTVASTPRWDVRAERWHTVTPETVGRFSAVAYYFGRHIHRELGVPVGLISTNWGGTRAEAWTSRKGLASFTHFAETAKDLAALDNPAAYMSGKQAVYNSLLAQWEEELLRKDTGIREGRPVYAEPAFDDTDWQQMSLPQAWERAGLPGYDGVVWFRSTFDVPGWLTGEQMLLHLGEIDEQDQTWINGVKIGETDRHNIPRVYQVSSDILQAGRNVLTIRVLDTGGGGGFTASASDMRIEAAGPSRAMPIPLAGEWKYRAAVPLGDLSQRPSMPRIQDLPSVLFNGMIAPLTPLRVKGAIWYQGESNAGRAFEYRRLFPAMIRDWRSHWNQAELPFFFVQLANYRAPQTDPGEQSAWAELREAQMMALQLEQTGMAVTIDIGEADDIHPRNKQDVGARLAQSALAVAYDNDAVASGPLFRAMEVEGMEARLSFDYVDGGLVAGGDSLTGFVMAGPDSQFVWAKARIEGDQVVVTGEGISDPVAVRYGWADNPDVNLYNRAGLPASPFRTDGWPGVTMPE